MKKITENGRVLERQMKITYYDKFALTPKRCSICNKLFWLEWYNYRVKFVGIEQYPLELPVCYNCGEQLRPFCMMCGTDMKGENNEND